MKKIILTILSITSVFSSKGNNDSASKEIAEKILQNMKQKAVLTRMTCGAGTHGVHTNNQVYGKMTCGTGTHG